MDFSNLNNDNVLLYAIKSYNTPNMILSEFNADFKRISYIRKLFKKYMKTHEIRERLILNHLIVLCNVFGIEPTIRLLFQQIDVCYYPLLKPFLVYLNYLPNTVYGIDNYNINTTDIKMDDYIVNLLRIFDKESV